MSVSACLPVDSIEASESRATLRLGLEHALRSARLDHDHVQRVPDHVVQLPGDARALIGHGLSRPHLALALEQARPLLDDARCTPGGCATYMPRPQAAAYVA